MLPSRRRWSIFALLGLLACRDNEKKPVPTAASANASASVAAIAKDPGATTSKLSNLLYTTDASVAVSSKVDNPKDFPEHLIDGKPETAWNGRTGDLTGWIAFRVPAKAHIAWIALSTGFDKKDLFTQNHRIKKIRITRNKEKAREVVLDVEQRGPQKIPLDVDGGEIRIDVVETVPGTKKEWKELTVSELSVWGDPKDAKLPKARIPRVTVGSFEAPKAKSVTPDPLVDSFEAYCKDYEAREKPAFLAAKDDYPGFIEPPYCTVGDALVAKPPAPFLEIRSVTRTDTRARTANVGVRTKKGIFFTNIDLGVEDLRNPGCAGGCTQQRKSVEIVSTPKGPALATVVDEHCWNNPWPSPDGEGTPGSSTYRERAEVCTVTDGGDLACTAYDVSTTEATYREYEDDFGRVAWSTPKRRRLLPTGELVFE